jgi:hypothetical protein
MIDRFVRPQLTRPCHLGFVPRCRDHPAPKQLSQSESPPTPPHSTPPAPAHPPPAEAVPATSACAMPSRTPRGPPPPHRSSSHPESESPRTPAPPAFRNCPRRPRIRTVCTAGKDYPRRLRHLAHCRQLNPGDNSTRQPGLTRSQSSPTARTSPAISLPKYAASKTSSRECRFAQTNPNG